MSKVIISILFLVTMVTQAWGQQEYFSDYNKSEGLIYFQKKIYNGCVALKEKQEPVSSKELKEIGEKVIKDINKSFAQAFKENPKVQYAFERDIRKVSDEPSCQRFGNSCRAKVVATAMYYMQQLRPDIHGCEVGKETDKRCSVEKTYRKASLEGVRTHYGAIGPGSYKKELLAVKNSTLIDVFNSAMKKDKDNLHICNEVLSGLPYRYSLDFEEEGLYNEGIDPDYNPNKKTVADCQEPKKVLSAVFLPTSLELRSSSGRDVVEPVKTHVDSFLKSHPEMLITDVDVTVTASKHPHIADINGKRGIDPESDAKSLAQATEKLIFVQKILEEVSKSSTQYTHIKFKSSAKIAGPDFTRMDLNDRFVTKMTPGYFDRVKRIFESNKETFQKDALIQSHDDLFDENKYPNLYQARYKPFQGFRIEISGHIKSQMKCSSQIEAPKKQTKPKVIRQ